MATQTAVHVGKRVSRYLNHCCRDIAFKTVGFCLASYLTSTRLVTFASITGDSMTPTLDSEALAIVDLVTPVTKLKPKDIVLCHDPEHSDKYIVKRIGGLAGQFIEIVSEHPGKYVEKKAYDGKLSVPSGYCWLEGDNKAESIDSREYGPVPLGLIVGKVIFNI